MDLCGVLELVEDSGARPVVLRGFDELPGRVAGDVDLLVREEAVPAVAARLDAAGFDAHVSRGVTLVAGARPHRKFRRADGLLLDVVERLCYRAPFVGGRPWVAVDPVLTAWTLERRVPHASGAFHVPSPLDAFAHLLCHAIFDKRAFLPATRERLASDANALPDTELEPVLSRLFFRVWEQVLDRARAARFDELLALQKLTGY